MKKPGNGLWRASRVIGLLLSGMALFIMLIRWGAHPPAFGSSTDPEIQNITVTVGAGLRLSDTMPGGGNSRVLWITGSGQLTLAVNLTGTPPLTLTTGPAFDWNMPRTFTSTSAPAVFDSITYTVSPISAAVVLTAESSLPNLITRVLLFLPDGVPPTVTVDSPIPSPITSVHPSLVLSGTFTDTAQVDSSEVEGSGVKRVTVLTDSETIANTTGITVGTWSTTWLLPSVDRTTYTLRITATDFLENYAWLTREVAVDRKGPTITWISPLPNAVFTTSQTSPVVISGTVSDASGVASVYVLTDVESLASLNNEVWEALWSLPTTDWVTYTLRVTATDNVGNTSWLTRPVGVDTRAPPTPGLGSPVPTNTWRRLPSGLPITWTQVTDNAGVRYRATLFRDGNSISDVVTTTTGITFPVDTGIYTVTLRAYDGLGNGSDSTQLGPFKVDHIEPSASLQLPATAYRTFPITLTASDGHSGIVSYTVVYTCPGCPGPGWTTFISQTFGSPQNMITVSGTFTAPVFYFTQTLVYTFTAWVEDQAGNVGSVSGTVRVRPAVIALPLVLRNYCPPVIWEIEPNNSRDQANCVAIPWEVSGYANDSSDQNDWFRMEITATGRITLTLEVPAGVDLDLYLQHQSDVGQQWTAKSNQSGYDVDEQIVYDVDQNHLGIFYILVYRYAGQSSSPYKLKIQR